MKCSPLLPVILAVVLAGCNGKAGGETDPVALANQAESLERAANATTDQLIEQIEDEAAAERPVSATVNLSN
jgi:outer membrane PBP1 activator LpoA protein